MITKSNFKEELAKKNIILTDTMVNQFDQYFKLIAKYNDMIDLTAITDEDETYDRHFYNSISIAFNNDFNNISFCDVGAGAGFPSIPLKICFPNMKLTIIDPLRKRMRFLEIVIEELGLKDVNIVVARAEDVSKEHKEEYDIVSARAVARLNILVELICQLPKVNGSFIAMKGINGKEELDEAKNALNIANLTLTKEEFLNPSNNYYFTKTDHVNPKYPRNFGQIKNKPL